MAPDKDRKQPKTPREEFEVAYYTKELGRPLQRKLLQRRLNDFSESSITAANDGDEPSWEGYSPPPPEDRAG